MKSWSMERKASAAAPSDCYNSQFFADSASGSRSSARQILRLLSELYPFHSVLDVGCGQGSWLSVAEELGATRLVGIDGPWVDRQRLASKNIAFYPVNLEGDFAPAEAFDLCISMEVAEHLSPDVAAGFVKNLCAAADVVVFSAAVRLQGGTLHINEQWQSYWAQLFAVAGFGCHDLFRTRLWTERGVESWYRQNTLLYVRHSHWLTAVVKDRLHHLSVLDVIHPEIYERNLENYQKAFDEPTLALCCRMFGRWGKRQLGKISRR